MLCVTRRAGSVVHQSPLDAHPAVLGGARTPPQRAHPAASPLGTLSNNLFQRLHCSLVCLQLVPLDSAGRRFVCAAVATKGDDEMLCVHSLFSGVCAESVTTAAQINMGLANGLARITPQLKTLCLTVSPMQCFAANKSTHARQSRLIAAVSSAYCSLSMQHIL